MGLNAVICRIKHGFESVGNEPIQQHPLGNAPLPPAGDLSVCFLIYAAAVKDYPVLAALAGGGAKRGHVIPWRLGGRRGRAASCRRAGRICYGQTDGAHGQTEAGCACGEWPAKDENVKEAF